MWPDAGVGAEAGIDADADAEAEWSMLLDELEASLTHSGGSGATGATGATGAGDAGRRPSQPPDGGVWRHPSPRTPMPAVLHPRALELRARQQRQSIALTARAAAVAAELEVLRAATPASAAAVYLDAST